MIYLLGGSGYVGEAFQHTMKRQGITYKNIKRSDLDYTDTATLIEALKADQPDFLINAAGYTGKPNVDACELDKANCLFGNAILPGRIADACEAVGISWGHVSSGCIYTGERADGAGFTEEDAPNFTFRQNNCSFYSGSKALGEEIISSRDNCYIWRLRILFNEVASPRNYLSKLMNYDSLLEAKNSISQLDEFVSACLDSWLKRVPYGIYNVTNPGAITTREVVELILASGVRTKDYKFFEDESQFMQIAAKTPRSNCVMDSSKLARAGIELSPVREAIKTALKNWRGR